MGQKAEEQGHSQLWAVGVQRPSLFCKAPHPKHPISHFVCRLSPKKKNSRLRKMFLGKALRRKRNENLLEVHQLCSALLIT